MTLFEALETINKGRIIDSGCDYQLIALARGTYFFKTKVGVVKITVNGKQGENAMTLKQEYNKQVPAWLQDTITEAKYIKPRKLTFSDFLRIAEYLNDICNGGHYRRAELLEIAHNYFSDYNAKRTDINLSRVAELLEEAKNGGELTDIDFYISELRRLENEQK